MTLWSCKVKKEDKVGGGPQKMAVNLSLIEQYSRAFKHKVMFVFCYFSSTNRTKVQLPIYFLFNRFELTCIYMETMATTSESADKSAASKVFECGKIRALTQHVQHLSHPFRTLQSCRKAFAAITACRPRYSTNWAIKLEGRGHSEV